jgi:hypothetical protein
MRGHHDWRNKRVIRQRGSEQLYFGLARVRGTISPRRNKITDRGSSLPVACAVALNTSGAVSATVRF